MLTKSPVGILYIIDQLDFGGAERQLLELVKRLDKHEFKLHVCSLWPPRALADEFVEAGTVLLPIHKRRRIDLSVVFKLAAYIRNHNITIVQTILPTANLWGRLAAIFACAPIIIASERVINPESEKRKHPFHFYSGRLLGRWTDAIITNSQAGLRDVIRFAGVAPGRCICIYNGLDLDRFHLNGKADVQFQRLAAGIRQHDALLEAVGRLALQKDYFTLLKAMHRIHAVMPNVGLAIIGDGELRKDLEKLAQTLGLQNSVYFLGWRTDIPELVSLCDVFVLSSLWEGFPNVIMEAMAIGKPVVATNVDGNVELVMDGETGLVVPSGDPESLAQAILRLLKDKVLAERMGISGRQRVEQLCGMDRMVSQTVNLYRGLIAKKLNWK